MKATAPAQRFIILGNLENRRVQFFQQALARLDFPAATLISWIDFLTGRVHLSEIVEPDAILRIESPGENFKVEKRLLALGADAGEVEGNSTLLSKSEVESLTLDPGLIRHSRQWYLGFRAALQSIETQLATCPPHQVMNAPADIAIMFDKRRCHTHLFENDVPVPCALPPVHNFEQLLHAMREAGLPRVFIKPAHGSSASGVVALATNRNQIVAYTSVEMVRNEGNLRLYNSIKIKRYDSIAEVAPLVDALCHQRVHVEQWLPKAGLNGQACDLRVVVVDGSASHVVVRCSHSPMTNLHLGNSRGNLETLRKRINPEHWRSALQSCERALAAFPHSHYAGVDLLISNNFKHHAVLEMNAFGDLLPNILHDGHDTYEREIITFTRQAQPAFA
ncbi:STM4014 family protein [Pedosphaera parvula]|uniref:ATP-grasp domain-containing protein n=1 Tax=Pedosphaera parvula (strain Ellin514) TaxID=320771 RepID=B9XL19_PEDPL|nr:STM4014 family protein [Pedosphaera parvula]EEF59513.1 conserved hypothetical protein [Pedosphaera parvula Ellin514]